MERSINHVSIRIKLTVSEGLNSVESKAFRGGRNDR